MAKRVFMIVLDSLGVGALPDASAYGDEGANTLLHVWQRCAPTLPNLRGLGLCNLPGLAGGVPKPQAQYGRLRELSAGKDTTTGHWELLGLVLDKPFPTFPDGFPSELCRLLERETGLRFLGNRPASGTAILEELGAEHLRTGRPILYTSADSVLQLAAHVSLFPPEKLYRLCRQVRGLCQGPYGVGRVIARPFSGEPGAFVRTADRRDFSLEPPKPTLLDELCERGLDVLGVGKISDIFAGRGLCESHPTHSNQEGMERLLALARRPFHGLCLANLVDFDMLYGHRRDAAGYSLALEAFDAFLPGLLERLGPEDLLLLTGDHGCDPCHAGTDHTREWVPLLLWSRTLAPRPLGDRLGLHGAARAIEAWLSCN